jgi:formylmethanofuran:tetrahydromethanopterin formyltransferase
MQRRSEKTAISRLARPRSVVLKHLDAYLRAARTTTSLSTSYDGVVYVATRNYDGNLSYFTNQ